MAELQQALSNSVFEVAKGAGDIVPGIAILVSSVQLIWAACENVRLQKAQCKQLAAFCQDVVKALNENLEGVSDVQKGKLVARMHAVLEDVLVSVKMWGHMNVWDAFTKQDRIHDSIQEKRVALADCFTVFGIASQLRLQQYKGPLSPTAPCVEPPMSPVANFSALYFPKREEYPRIVSVGCVPPPNLSESRPIIIPPSSGGILPADIRLEQRAPAAKEARDREAAEESELTPKITSFARNLFKSRKKMEMAVDREPSTFSPKTFINSRPEPNAPLPIPVKTGEKRSRASLQEPTSPVTSVQDEVRKIELEFSQGWHKLKSSFRGLVETLESRVLKLFQLDAEGRLNILDALGAMEDLVHSLHEDATGEFLRLRAELVSVLDKMMKRTCKRKVPADTHCGGSLGHERPEQPTSVDATAGADQRYGR